MDPDDLEQPYPPASGSEVATLVGSLERQRATLAWKTGGLDAGGLSRRVAASSLTSGGLLKHLAYWPLRSAADDSPEYLYSLWNASVVRSRAAVADALADGDLGRRVAYQYPALAPRSPA